MGKTKLNRQFLERLFDSLLPFLAVLGAFIIGALFLLVQSVNPLEAYQAMVVDAFGSKNDLTDALVKATPLLLVGLGIAIAFRGGVIKYFSVVENFILNVKTPSRETPVKNLSGDNIQKLISEDLDEVQARPHHYPVWR